MFFQFINSIVTVVTAGPCCGSSCKYLANNVCRNVTDCTLITKCAGRSFSCPDPSPKPDNATECAGGLKVCLKGECKISVCEKYGMQECKCSKEGEECDLCCQQTGLPNTCQSAKNLAEVSYFKKFITLFHGKVLFHPIPVCSLPGFLVLLDPLCTPLLFPPPTPYLDPSKMSKKSASFSSHDSVIL